MQKKKLQDSQKKNLTFNHIVIVGELTQKGDLSKSIKGNAMLKFILSNTAFCIAVNEKAQMINTLDLDTTLLVEGKLIRIENTNLLLVSEVEIYTTQEEIDTKKLRKELKKEKTEF